LLLLHLAQFVDGLLHLGSGGYWLWGAPAGKQEGESDKKSQSFDHWIHHSPIMG